MKQEIVDYIDSLVDYINELKKTIHVINLALNNNQTQFEKELLLNDKRRFIQILIARRKELKSYQNNYKNLDKHILKTAI